MNKKSIIFLIIVSGIFIGNFIYVFSNQKSVEEDFFSDIPTEVSDISLSSIDLLFGGKADSLLDLFIDEYKYLPKSKDEINKVTEQFKIIGKPLNIETIGYNYDKNGNNESHKVSYQLELGNKWLVFSSIIVKVNDGYKLYRFDFNGIEDSLLKTNRFSLKNKGILNYIILLMIVMVMIFTFITSAICFGSDGKKRVLWSILILCGIGSLGLNWTTSELEFSLLNIGTPSYDIERVGTYFPIILSIRFPLFAILYWVKRRNQKVRKIAIKAEIEIEQTDDEIQ